MVAFVPSAKKSKVAPRRHWSTMQGLLMHSRQLHQVLEAIDQHEESCMRMQTSRTASVSESASHGLGMAQAKPIVFRKTKREIQRERERALQQQQLELTATTRKTDPINRQESNGIMRQLSSIRSTILSSCQRLTGRNVSTQRRLTYRSPYAQRTNGYKISHRCPPRRRLLF